MSSPRPKIESGSFTEEEGSLPIARISSRVNGIGRVSEMSDQALSTSGEGSCLKMLGSRLGKSVPSIFFLAKWAGLPARTGAIIERFVSFLLSVIIRNISN